MVLWRPSAGEASAATHKANPCHGFVELLIQILWQLNFIQFVCYQDPWFQSLLMQKLQKLLEWPLVKKYLFKHLQNHRKKHFY